MENKYNDTVKLLTSSGKFRISLGLTRISEVLEILGNPQDNLKYIHVAGTNGKGSVCSIISKILEKSGRKVGLFTSPHIFDYTERIKINSTDITKSDFAKYVTEICDISDKNEVDLTEFEILTAVMFKYFYDNEVDIVVLETGLGGRFDATNVIKSNICSVITHIDLDHTERLGNTISEIAFEKAGIIKPDCPVFTSIPYKEIEEKAKECNAELHLVKTSENTENLRLKGLYQKENLSLALSVIRHEFPEISESIIQNSLKEVEYPCRFQNIKNDIIIDASHNPNGITALKESLDYYYPERKRCFVFGCLRNKDYKKMIEILFSKDDEIYFCHYSNPNSCTFEELQAVCKYPAKHFTTLDKLPKDKLKIVCGSIYMLNEVIPRFLIHQSN